MSDFPKEAPTVLAAAVAAARRALREMDPDDVPESMRRVVASSSGRLPPPLARSLLTELDRSEWLRAEALEALEGNGPSRDFLERGEGWWASVATGIADARAGAYEARARDSAAEITALSSDVKHFKVKARKARRDLDAAAADARSEVAAARKRLETALGEARTKLTAARLEVAEAEAAVEVAVAERDEADAASRELAERVRTLRRDAAQAAGRVARGAAASVPREGLALARHMDLLAAMVPVPEGRMAAASVPVGGEPGSVRVGASLAIPGGIRPDSAEAVIWLLRQETDFALVVDGHNVLFHLDAATATSGEARKRLVADLSRFRALATTRPAVVVVFDSHIPGSREPGYRHGVELLYAEAGVAADDIVVEVATEFSIPVVVVSSDRAVREATEDSAALALWAEALGEWLRRV